jgi:hypothetical protein
MPQFGTGINNPRYGSMGTQEQDWNLGQWRTQQNMNMATMNPWQQMDFDPQNPFGSTWFNPTAAGGTPFQVTPGMMQQQQQEMWWNDPFRDFINPATGTKSINVAGYGNTPLAWKQGGEAYVNPAAMGAFGGGQQLGQYGQGGGAAGPEWNYQTPGEWGGYQFDPNQLDPRQAMAAWQPWAEEQRTLGFNEAAARMGPGATGFTMSTPYAEALGGVARRSAEDLGRIGAEYQFRSASENARNQLQRQLAEQGADLSAWGTHGGWQQQGGLGEQAFNLDRWRTGEGLGLERDRMGMQRDIAQAGLDQNQQAMMMQMLASMMGGF